MPTSTRLASTFGSYNRLIIVFHRKSGADLTPWNFVPYNAEAGEFDMQGILIHELGHCLGLDHSTGANDTMNGGYEYHRQRFGPFSNDVQRLRSVYSLFAGNRLRELVSTSHGAAWSSQGNNLTTEANTTARTNITPGVTQTPASGMFLVGWTSPGTAPTWLRGDGNTFLFTPWYIFGGERSVYGPAYAANDGGSILWAWVDNDDQGTIKLVRSTSDGLSWFWVGTPAGARTHGTPALAFARLGGVATWVLAWAAFNRADRSQTGHIMVSVSTNDGASWSAPQVVQSYYRALSGVSLAAAPDGRMLLAFAWAPHGTYGLNLIRAVNLTVAGGAVTTGAMVYSSWGTRIQPALAYDPQADRWLMAWREQDFNTSINVASKAAGDGAWGSLIRPGARSHTAPALAHSSPQGRAVLWYAFE